MIFNLVFGIWIFILIGIYRGFWSYLDFTDEVKATRIEDENADRYFKKIYLVMIPITIMAIISKFA